MSAFASSTPTGDPAAVPPPAQLLSMASIHFAARSLQIIASMNIADHITAQPRPAAAIAADAGVNADALHRMLRLLASHGLFLETPQGWTHTPASELLRNDHPASMRAFVAMMGDPINWEALAVLDHTLRTGENAAARVHPGGVWGYYAENPADARQFDAAMTAKSHGDLALLIAAADFNGVETVADIGGGRGHFLAAILEAQPRLRGVLFDQPDVVAMAVSHPRLAKIGGDFFKGGLPTADLYLMTHVIHDWTDAESIAILKSVRAAAPANARLIVYELALPEGPEPHAAKAIDVIMLTITGGRERTAADYTALFNASGWRADGVIPTPAGMALHQARPV